MTGRGDAARLVSKQWGIGATMSTEAKFELPTGTVTFLLTDVAGSTRMWETDTAMRGAIVRHYDILAEAVDTHGGIRPQEQGEGDSIVAAFARPSDALAAASDAHRALTTEPWPTSQPIRVRMAIHTGEAHLRDNNNYAGQAIIRTARLRAIGHGGQILVSNATRDLAVDQRGNEFELRSLGDHRLRDLGRPEHVWELITDDGASTFPPLLSLDTTPNSLPISVSPFIGRETDIAELAHLVTTERLVTATGTGGAGKTRIAQQVGAELIDQFPAGVWWVELAPLDDSATHSAVRAAFGISQAATLPIQESIRRKLGDQPCLLIVDNCEHVTTTIAPLIHELLTTAPTLHILATSRVMLDIPGEHAWRIPPLTLPNTEITATVDTLNRCDSVRLFCDRARRARPNFELTNDNGFAVAHICHRLGGIPLAIELAAARTRMLDPQQIHDGLANAFRILTGGSKTLMARQQTLDASITWSYNLLGPAEQTLLRRLSVFVDGWTLDAAESICPTGTEHDTLDQYQVFDALDRLVDHSLVDAIDTPAGPRFAMLETVRQYAHRQLAANPAEQNTTQNRHAQHFTNWVASLQHERRAEVTDQQFDSIVEELSNVLAASSHVGKTDPDQAVNALWGISNLAHTLWQPLRTAVLAQLDQFAGCLQPENEWKMLLVRVHLNISIDWDTVFDSLAKAEKRADATNQPLGANLARVTSLALAVTAGAPVTDEIDEVLKNLDGLNRHFARRYRVALAALAAVGGYSTWAKATLDSVGPIKRSALISPYADLGQGLIALARGDAAAAVELITHSLDCRFQPLALDMALFCLTRAGAELGLDLTSEPERRLRRICDHEGIVAFGGSADFIMATRCLLTDDLDEAASALRRATHSTVSLGYEFLWPRGRYLLVAAGIADEGLGSVDPSDPNFHLIKAEHDLRANNTDGALTSAQDALGRTERAGLGDQLLTLECLSRIHTVAGHHDIATRIAGACRQFRTERSLVAFPCLQRLLDDAAAASRAALGDTDYNAALADGATLTLEAASDYAR